MKTQTPNIRFVNARPEHIADAINVASQAFSVYNIDRALHEHRFTSDPENRYSRIRVGILDSRVIAAIRLYWRTFSVAKASIPMAIIGDVAVAKDRQGSGIGHCLLQNTVEYLKEQRILLAWLGGRPSFYNQFGFSMLTESRLIIEPQSVLNFNNTTEHSLSTSPKDLLESGQWHQLWEVFRNDCYSRFHRSPDFSAWLLKDRNFGCTNDTTCLSLHDNQELTAYVLAQQLGKRISIHEIAWKNQNIDSVGILFKNLTNRFPHSQEIVLGGPSQPDLRKWMTLNNIGWRHEELASFPMSLILDRTGLIEAICQNWQTSITKTEKPKPLAIIGPDGSAALLNWQSHQAKTVPISALPENVIIVNIDQGQLIKLLLGFSSARQLNLAARLGLSQADSNILEALFPNSSGFLGDLERA